MKKYDIRKFRTLVVGFTQADMALQMGVSPNTISRWECKRLKMSKIAQAFLRYIIESDAKTLAAYEDAIKAK